MFFKTAKTCFLKYIEWVLHLLFWGLYFKGVNTQWSVNWFDPKTHLPGVAPISAFLFPVFFYLNAFWLIPKFLRGGKRYRYFLVTIGILILVELARACVFVWSSGVDLPFQDALLSQLVGRYSFFIGGPNSLFFAIFFSFAYKFTRDWMKHDRQIEQLEKEKMAMELNLLKSQMNPHFLFNNLNALDDLIDSDTDLAKKYLHKLSGIYRYSIVNMEQDVVSLEEEWQAIDNYIFLLEERFGKAYKFEKQNELGDLDAILIPPGALQTLVENAVKHNQGNVSEPLLVSISVKEAGISVSNPKILKPNQNNSLGTGLKNLNAKYKILSKKPISIEDGLDFIVTLPLIWEVE